MWCVETSQASYLERRMKLVIRGSTSRIRIELLLTVVFFLYSNFRVTDTSLLSGFSRMTMFNLDLRCLESLLNP
jgi:hypothetical protein